jgi:glycine/D-amino acid oxidase-like deaminating enzyme
MQAFDRHFEEGVYLGYGPAPSIWVEGTTSSILGGRAGISAEHAIIVAGSQTTQVARILVSLFMIYDKLADITSQVLSEQ